jgi:hypothetical protein
VSAAALESRDLVLETISGEYLIESLADSGSGLARARVTSFAPGGRFTVVPTYEITITGLRLAEPFAITIEASDGREALSKLITKESTPLEAWAGEGFIELRLEKRRS